MPKDVVIVGARRVADMRPDRLDQALDVRWIGGREKKVDHAKHGEQQQAMQERGPVTFGDDQRGEIERDHGEGRHLVDEQRQRHQHQALPLIAEGDGRQQHQIEDLLDIADFVEQVAAHRADQEQHGQDLDAQARAQGMRHQQGDQDEQHQRLQRRQEAIIEAQRAEGREQRA